jgi:hypothetical protein
MSLRAVAARLANHRSRLARNRRLVDGGNALDDLAVTRNHLPGDHTDSIAHAQMRACDLFDRAVRQQLVGRGLRLRLAQRVRLRLAAALRHRRGKICEQHREPEPQRDLQVEAEVVRPAGQHQQQRRHDAAYFHHKHHRVLGHLHRVQLLQRVNPRPPHDGRFKQRPLLGSSRMCCTHLLSPTCNLQPATDNLQLV